jgi:hypothetical protein
MNDEGLRATPARLLALAWTVGQLLAPKAAAAQPQPEPVEAAVPTTAAQPNAPAAATASSPPADLEQLKSELERLQKELDSARQTATDAQKTAEEARQAAADAQQAADDAANGGGNEPQQDVLRIYGFAEAGFERSWVDDSTGVGVIQAGANASSFVLGNLDLYFDAQPVQGWRSLIEVRFSNGPLGAVSSYGGLAGSFARVDTRTPDPNAASSIATQWGGSLIIERAQIDWTPTQLFKLRFGEFFTPFGIWNVDHGAPTLIPIALPIPVAFRNFPLRQIGLQAYGNAFVGPWELGYIATLTNGRQELSTFAFDDDRGYGGRLYAAKDAGDFVLKFGVSAYAGTTRDKQIDLVSFAPPTFANRSTFRYHEWTLGADFALDVNDTRIRVEGIVHRVDYDVGQHEINPTNPTQFLPNRYETGGYAVIAQGLPWFGLEPYLMAEGGRLPFPIPGVDTAFTPSVGLNLHVHPSVLFKAQLLRSMFFSLRNSSKIPNLDVSDFNVTSLFTRLVLVF